MILNNANSKSNSTNSHKSRHEYELTIYLNQDYKFSVEQ